MKWEAEEWKMEYVKKQRTDLRKTIKKKSKAEETYIGDV